MLGREIRNRFSLLRPPPISDIVREKLEKRDEGNRETKFELGQKVMVKDYRKGGRPWVQGLIIGESMPGVSYIIDVDGLKWKRHVNQMLSCSVFRIILS
ncbi:Integrase domain containing protein [Operophtera brumata]|uniref:Integrase domain containing protein n=1 Tax=Operophtera brumata TaxID=104452 RepID=A0A0L7L7Y2_OPEBR|nr:Integrase domain containing protein [Operophtera brumata]